MSYILDALVKADQERQRQMLPGLHSLPSAAWSGRGLRLPWPAVITGGTLAAAGLVLAGVHWWPVPVATPATAVVPPASPPGVASLEKQGSSLPPAVRPGQPPPISPGRVETTPARPGKELAAARIEQSAKKARPDRRIYDIAELPADLRKEAQRLTVAGVAQANDAAERMAIINDRPWREGDEVTEGLRVERISSNGVVFNLRGYRFRKGGA